jgi:uncharacterized membrane protein YkvA (DUF1232 family)
MAFEAPDYAASLRQCIEGYHGAHEAAVRRAAEVFEFYARLFAEVDLPASARDVVNAVLAYFVAPADVLPEQDLGPFGLLDDLFVASHGFRRLRKEVADPVIQRAWRGAGDLDDVMSEVYSQSRSAVGKNGRAALRLAGLG